MISPASRIFFTLNNSCPVAFRKGEFSHYYYISTRNSKLICPSSAKSSFDEPLIKTPPK